MAFLSQVSAAVILVTLTLLIQSVGIAALIYWGSAHFARDRCRLGYLRSAVLMVRFTGLIIVLHISQVAPWAGFYRWNCLPSWESALYFSIATYSTVGSGDLLLPAMWRTLGAVESVTGVLMCGVSAAFLFAIVTRLVEREARFSPELARLAGERASTPGTLRRRPVVRRRA